MPACEYRVRMMEPRDMPTVWAIARAQNRRDGTSYPFPPVFEMRGGHPKLGQLLPNVPLALVTESRFMRPHTGMLGRPWRIRCGHVFLRTIEVMSFGGGVEEMRFSMSHIPAALEILKQRGYVDAHAFVPGHRATPDLTHELQEQGLDRIDYRLAHFFRMI